MRVIFPKINNHIRKDEELINKMTSHWKVSTFSCEKRNRRHDASFSIYQQKKFKKRLDEIKNFLEQVLDNLFNSNMFYNATVGTSASIIWILRWVSTRVTSTLIIFCKQLFTSVKQKKKHHPLLKRCQSTSSPGWRKHTVCHFLSIQGRGKFVLHPET